MKTTSLNASMNDLHTRQLMYNVTYLTSHCSPRLRHSWADTEDDLTWFMNPWVGEILEVKWLFVDCCPWTHAANTELEQERPCQGEPGVNSPRKLMALLGTYWKDQASMNSLSSSECLVLVWWGSVWSSQGCLGPISISKTMWSSIVPSVRHFVGRCWRRSDSVFRPKSEWHMHSRYYKTCHNDFLWIMLSSSLVISSRNDNTVRVRMIH